MSCKKSRKVLGNICGLFIVFGLFAAGPLYADGVFVSAGGPYEADVGEEIEFDASLSAMSDGSAIDGYYWDWDGDGKWDECFSLPKAKHAWHSAFSGMVRLFIFYLGGVEWADAHVTVNGPETAMAITVSSNATLRVRDEMGRFIGIDPDTGLFDMDIAGVTMTLVPPAVSEFKEAPVEKWDMQYDIPLVNGSTYELTLTGVETGWFEVEIHGIRDGNCCPEKYLVGLINEGEEIKVDVSACCKDGELGVVCGALRYCPEMKVDPDDKIELLVQPGGLYSKTITISETEGLRPICAIVLSCSELTGTVYTIPVSDITFDENGFNVAAGGKQDVIMTVQVPEFFVGQVAGTLTVTCASGASKEIDVIVRKAGTHAPLIEIESPLYGTVGSPVEFDATGSVDIDGEIDKYCWDWDLTGQYECVDGPVVSHTWDRTFSGVVRLRAVDNEGNASETYVQVVITE